MCLLDSQFYADTAVAFIREYSQINFSRQVPLDNRGLGIIAGNDWERKIIHRFL